MENIQVVVPTEEAGKINKLLSKSGWDFSVVSGKENTLFMITAEEEETEDILRELKSAGVGREFGKIQVSALAVSLPTIKAKRPFLSFQRVSNEEIIQIVEKSTKINVNYFILTLLAGVLASFGLLGNNAAVVIGSMVISPLLGPVTGAAMGTILTRRKMFQDSVKAEAAGILLAIFIGLFLTHLYPGAAVTSEILARGNPNLADIVLAIVSGFAAAVAFSGGLESTLVGVAVAASLLPPAANIGIAIALGQYSIAWGSAELLLINIFCINLACTSLFWLQGIRPSVSARREKIAARVLRTRLVAVLIALLVLAIPLGSATITMYRQSTWNNVVSNTVYLTMLQNNAVVGNIGMQYYSTSNMGVVNVLIYVQGEVSPNIARTISLVISLATGIPTITVITAVNATAFSILG